ncbi:MAG TPA: polysaccharide biosynthesis protein [Oscillospiraceae bacterium]|nr:polysaccharide biosynthesis protein [Oscillospiraceae bacterium]
MQTKAKRKNQSFLHGAFILTVGIVIVKVIGALFKIPLKWTIDNEGFGYYNTAYSFCAPLFSLATAGFPIAIARMVSENYTRGRFRDIRQIYRASVPIFIVTGTSGFLIMLFGASAYVNYIGSSGALPAMYVLAPTILFCCLSSIYRGYYEGLRNMYPTAISQVIEAVCKLVVGLAAAYFLVQSGMKEYAVAGTVFGTAYQSADLAKKAALPYAAAGAIAGVTVGSLFSFLYLLISHKKNSGGITKEELAASCPPQTMRFTVAKLVKTAIPIGIGALAVNVAGLIDATFLQTRIGDIMRENPTALLNLYKGMIPSYLTAKEVPNYLFGSYSIALTLFGLIPALIQAFSMSALPNVTAAWTRGVRSEIKKSMETVLRITVLVSVPIGLGMSVLARPIISLVFGTDQIASRVMVILGVAAAFAAVSVPIFSMLQAVGRVDLPVKLLFVGLTIKVVLNYILAGIPKINVLGAGIGTLVCYALITVFSLIFLCRITKIIPNFTSVILKPLFASALCGVAAYMAQSLAVRVIPDKLATCAAIVIAGFVYLISLLCLRAISRDDVIMLPKGQKIAKILEKHNWIG